MRERPVTTTTTAESASKRDAAHDASEGIAVPNEESAVIVPHPQRGGSARLPAVYPAPVPRKSAPPSSIQIERLILHQLDSAHDHLELVDEEVVLDAHVGAFFAGQIAAAAERADWRAAFLDAQAEVPLLCRRLLAGSEDFVAASRQLALRLYDQMRARPNLIAPGDFVVAVFRRADAEPHLALLKLDLDNGRLVRQFVRSGGRTTVRVAAAENLLPEARRLQKCALVRDSAASGFDVTLLDSQAGPRSDGVAAFFYRGFLTAALVPSARRRTRLFLTASETWIAAHTTLFTPGQVLGFYRARRAALAADLVELATFAAAAVPDAGPDAHADAQALRSSLLDHLRAALFERGEPDVTGFFVDRATADPVVRTVTLELDGGTRLRVDANLFDALVRVTPRRTGEQKVQLVIESLTLREVAGG